MPLIEAYIPGLALGIISAVLRWKYATLVPRLRLPMREEFRDAVLLRSVGVPFMAFSFRDDRFLSVDEVYEWSSSLLLLCLGLSFRFGGLVSSLTGGLHGHGGACGRRTGGVDDSALPRDTSPARSRRASL
jgi:hypothetical protein